MLDKMILPRFSGLHDSLTVFGKDLHNFRILEPKLLMLEMLNVEPMQLDIRNKWRRMKFEISQY